MHAAYAVIFLLLAGICTGVTVQAWDLFGWPALILAYPAVSFLLLALAYALGSPGLFGKRPNGRLAFWGRVLFGPYFQLNALIFRLHQGLSREPAYAEVVPNLFFGRRLTNREAHTATQLDWLAVLDLAPEFAEVPSLRNLPGYRSFPILDATAPTEPQLRDTILWLAVALKNGPVYVHCALGHGRTGCVVVAYLLSAGIVKSIAEGVRLLQSQRAGVRLNRTQHRALMLTIPDAGFPR